MNYLLILRICGNVVLRIAADEAWLQNALHTVVLSLHETYNDGAVRNVMIFLITANTLNHLNYLTFETEFPYASPLLQFRRRIKFCTNRATLLNEINN